MPYEFKPTRTPLVLGVVAAAATLWIVMCAPRAVEAGAFPALFGTSEIRNENIQPFAKWTSVLTRHGREIEADSKRCATGMDGCASGVWRSFLGSISGQDPSEQLDAVNRFVNAVPYGGDRGNWGADDYWATPTQFLAGRGDCEDYAITKYLSLRTLGFSADNLRLVVVHDESRGMPHAVLVAYLDGEGYVLDNQIARVLPQSSVRHYRPYYSINERAWWLHRG